MEKRVIERKPLPPETRASDSIHLNSESLTFGFHTAEDSRKKSVAVISKTDDFDKKGIPIGGGRYDPLMGPLGKTDNKGNEWECETCGQTFYRCPGHDGHIELSLPVYHPLFMKDLFGIIQLTCPICQMFFCLGKASQIFSLVTPSHLILFNIYQFQRVGKLFLLVSWSFWSMDNSSQPSNLRNNLGLTQMIISTKNKANSPLKVT